MSLVVCNVHSRKLIVCNIRNRIIQFAYTNLGSHYSAELLYKLCHLEEEEREKEGKIISNIFQYHDEINISIIISKRYVSEKLIAIYLIQSWSLARRQKRLRHVIQ